MIVLLPILVMLIGAFVYVASTKNQKLAELGRIAFAVGLFFTVEVLAKNTLHFLAP